MIELYCCFVSCWCFIVVCRRCPPFLLYFVVKKCVVCLFVRRSFALFLSVCVVCSKNLSAVSFMYLRLLPFVVANFFVFLFINLCFFEKLEKIISCFIFIVVFYIRKLIQKQTFEDHKFLAFFLFLQIHVISKKKWQLNPAPTNLELPDL